MNNVISQRNQGCVTVHFESGAHLLALKRVLELAEKASSRRDDVHLFLVQDIIDALENAR